MHHGGQLFTKCKDNYRQILKGAQVKRMRQGAFFLSFLVGCFGVSWMCFHSFRCGYNGCKYLGAESI